MSVQKPLQGTELIECTQASAKLGLKTVVEQCGYGTDVESFRENLKQASAQMGIDVHKLYEIITTQEAVGKFRGVEIYPSSESSL